LSLLEKFIVRAKNKVANLGIGLDETEFHTSKILYATIKFLSRFKSNILLKVYMFGTEDMVNYVENNSSYLKYKDQIELITSEEPEKKVFKYFNEYKINAIVRGSFSSSKFLNMVKQNFNINQINRLALLETRSGYQFFFGPVGIDECNVLEKKIKFIEIAVNQLKTIILEPKVSILSGGRKGDIGRDAHVDELIKEGEQIVQ
jgi:predicted methyltransferase MtxX (methanogen marker protein 4)